MFFSLFLGKGKRNNIKSELRFAFVITKANINFASLQREAYKERKKTTD
jgi:hypothetical protein